MAQSTPPPRPAGAPDPTAMAQPQTPPPGAPPQQYAQQGPPQHMGPPLQGRGGPVQPGWFPPPGQHAPAGYPPVGHMQGGQVGGGGAGFGRVLLSEWTKIRTVRSTMWTLIVMAALIMGMALLLGGTVHVEPGDDYISISLIGVVMAQIAAATLGVLSISAEYTTGMIRTTLTAYPRRLQVLAAKAVVFAGLMFVVGLVTIMLAALLGEAMLTSRFGDAQYVDKDIFRSVVGSSLFLAVIGLLGLGLGALIRHSAGAITALLGAILLPMIIGPIVGGKVGDTIMEYSPMFALLRLIGGEEDGGFGPWTSLLLVAGYAAVALFAGATRLRSRDV